MAKLSERKYGPKPRTKDRDKTAGRYVARKEKFGDKVVAGTGYRLKTSGIPVRPTATGYVKKTYTKNTGATPYKAGPRTDAFVNKPFKPKYKSQVPNKPKTASASWGGVASWYDKHLNEADTYHEKVIQPNLLRALDPKKGEHILDLACGQGFFARAVAKSGAEVSGVDIAQELIAIAKAESPEIPYFVGSVDDLSMFTTETFDKALMSLALQNIENVEGALKESARVLKQNCELHIVMNHPAFRIPKQSSWSYDDKKKVQYRRVDEYLSNSKTEIDMHPGFTDSPKTLSFHRPLQFYVKAFAKTGFAITRLEEWISHKASDSGPRAKAENDARKEIPLFLYLKVVKL